MMRLVWPDDDTMPRKSTPDDAPEPTDEATADAPTETPEQGGAAEGPVELPDGSIAPVEAPAAETEVGEDAGDAADTPVNLAILEALLFSTHHPLTPQRIGDLLEIKSHKSIKRAVVELNGQYEQSERSFRVEQVAGGYQLLSLPEFGDYLKRLHQKEIDSKLTKAALETLAIIAYKQPILRADVEAIRGVACGETIRSLMEKHLVKIAGRAEEPGRPILYGTTKRFLELFGLNSLKDLPQSEDSTLPPIKESAEG